MLRVGVGQAEDVDTLIATRSVIDLCREQLQGSKPRVGMILCSANFDHRCMLDMVLDSFPGIGLIGCTTAGDFSSSYGFSDDSITLVLFCSDTIELSVGIGYDLSRNDKKAVQTAVQCATAELTHPPSLCVALPDLFGKSANRVIEGLYNELQCPVFGGAAARQIFSARGMGCELPDHQIVQFFDDRILNDALPIMIFAGPVQFSFAVANSWQPLGKKARVTEAIGHEIRTIGDRKALEFYRHYLGEHANPPTEFPLAVYEPGQKRFYLRGPIQYDNLTGAVTFTEAIPLGSTVQITESVRDHILEDAKTSAGSLSSHYAGRPAVAMAFSCHLRKEALGTHVEEELSALREVLPQLTPIVGFYGYGEIAPLWSGEKSRFHNATLVILLLGEGDRTRESEVIDDEEPERRRKAERVKAPGVLSREDLKRENEFIKRKLFRSEAYRKRLEEVKELNASLHRQLIHEIDAARRKIELSEEALRRSEEKYRRIVETAGEGFLLMDENLIITDVNDAYCNMIGYEKWELIGKTPMDIATEDYRQFLLMHRDKLLSEDYRRFEGRLIAKNGAIVPILVHGSILRDSHGDLLGHMAFVTDLTDTKKALMLAAEVQKGFLPQSDPRVPGFEIAGKNIPCEEIGGDYYDYLYTTDSFKGRLGVVVGDITGHGVDAALIMTAARSFLRMRAVQTENIAEIVSDLNRHLSLEVFDAGRFMTLFYLAIDIGEHQLRWVRAGHDPAFLYHPSRDEFDELRGNGMAIGLDEAVSYQANVKIGLTKGDIIAIGTDGIWEAHNSRGEMFGKARFREIIRRQADTSAEEIVETVYAELKDFTAGMRPEDDITLVVIRFLEDF